MNKTTYITVTTCSICGGSVIDKEHCIRCEESNRIYLREAQKTSKLFPGKYDKLTLGLLLVGTIILVVLILVFY